MELFSEFHNRYFYIIHELLKASSERCLSHPEIAAISARLGFAETALFLDPLLKNSNGKAYVPLQKKTSGAVSLLKNPPLTLMTDLQKSWLKTMLNDKRINLFIDETEQQKYAQWLSNVRPLYDDAQILPVDRAGDGDPYDKAEYKAAFRTILQAIQEKRLLCIAYESGKSNRITAYFAPYKLEYSNRDDKFRLCAARMHHTKPKNFYKLNLSRIKEAVLIEKPAPPHLSKYIKEKCMPLPIEIEIWNERNGFERVFTQLSNYERISEYDKTAKKCFMKIFYYGTDEMELLITLLSFGPVIRVIGPEKFKRQIEERIARQRQICEEMFS